MLQDQTVGINKPFFSRLHNKPLLWREGTALQCVGKTKLDSNQAMYLPNHQALCTNAPGRIVITDRIENQRQPSLQSRSITVF